MFYRNYKRILKSLLLCVGLSLFVLSCTNNDKKGDDKTITAKKYDGPYSQINGTYGGVDDLGRTLSFAGDEGVPAEVRKDRLVGMFYYLWLGNHGLVGPYDITKVIEKDPNAMSSSEAWEAAGGGKLLDWHFWGEPLFGYYNINDDWVLRKHIQMLTDAGVDYLIFDTTNGSTYDGTALKMLEILDEYYQKGITNVPKVAYYTHDDSGRVIAHLYKAIYQKYTKYSHLWFLWDGKPLIVGDTDDERVTQEMRDFFRFKRFIWPQDDRVSDDEWPWVEFNNRLYTDKTVYGTNGRKEIVSVSPAQNSEPWYWFSVTAWYGGNSHTKSFHDGANDTSEDAVKYGYNFEKQWEWAIAQDPETIFVTQWNEWQAIRLYFEEFPQYPIIFIDVTNINTNRDIEPMRGGYGDNYYMQLTDSIRKYKGAEPRVDVGENKTISISGSFDQWENVTAEYRDYTNDTIDRNERGFGRKYTDDSGRNDINAMKVAKDDEYVYFYVDTVDDLTPSTDSNWMTLFLRTGSAENWNGFDYIVNRVSPKDGKAVLEKSSGGWNWYEVGEIECRWEGKKLMLAVPRNLIDVPADKNSGLLHLEFKWADNYIQDDIWSFYEKGDVAPIGRFTYVFSDIK